MIGAAIIRLYLFKFRKIISVFGRSSIETIEIFNIYAVLSFFVRIINIFFALYFFKNNFASGIFKKVFIINRISFSVILSIFCCNISIFYYNAAIDCIKGYYIIIDYPI